MVAQVSFDRQVSRKEIHTHHTHWNMCISSSCLNLANAQIDELVSLGRIAEALNLAQVNGSQKFKPYLTEEYKVTFGSPNLDMDPDELDKQRQVCQNFFNGRIVLKHACEQKLLAIQRRAGLAYMTQCHFSEGLELLAATNTDPREVA